jgi:2Fe-2S ferredoxin
MTSATYVHPDGAADTVTIEPGENLMSTALRHGVDGIVGECGGELMCATCHVFVTEPATLREVASPEEDEMLDFAACERGYGSRLGCQITHGAIAGERVVVVLPEKQS